MREDQLPTIGKEAAQTLLNSELRRRRQSLGGEVSGSADLAYNYGSYSTENNIVRGYFFSLWKLNHKGDWELLLDLETKIPKPK